MLESIQNALSGHLTSIIVSIVAIVAAKYVRQLFLVIEQKFAVDIDDKIEDMIAKLTKKAIRVVFQTFVREKKKANEWNLDTKKEALHKAFDLVAKDAKRMGVDSYLFRRNVIKEIEGELVNVKNENKK